MITGMLIGRLKQDPRPSADPMDRLHPDPAPRKRPSVPAPGLDRAEWEQIAEEALTRVFQATSAGLFLQGRETIRSNRTTDNDAVEPMAGCPDQPPGRQGFRLALTGSGTSFTPIIGACFHFESLRQLTAASGRQLGLKAVIVVRGQVVLLPETTALPGMTGHRSSRHQGPGVNAEIRNHVFPRASTPSRPTLLGLAELLPRPLERGPASLATGPAPCPLWTS